MSTDEERVSDTVDPGARSRRARGPALVPALVIVNPAAGRGRAAGRLRRAVGRVLPGATLRWTEGAGHARRLAAEAAGEGYGLVVAAGGDGLAGEVADGLLSAGGRPVMALLPIGTGNDLARALGIPADLEGALAVLAGGRPRRIDAGRLRCADSSGGRASGRHFVSAVVAGFGGRLRPSPGVKRRWGSAAYLREALGRLGELRPVGIDLRADGVEGGAKPGSRFEGRCLLVVVANGGSMGGGIRAAPDARLDDGLLDVVVVPELSGAAMVRTVARVLLTRRLPAGCWRCRCRTVELSASSPMGLNADGEVVGEAPAGFRIVPAALRVLVPDRSR